jgi:hypothetical protein
MKITKSSQTSKGSTSKKSSASSTVDFRQLLQGQMSPVQDVASTNPVTEVQEREQGDPQLRMQGVKLTESTIDSMESFATALADQALSTNDLEAFVTRLEEDSQVLVDIKAQLPESDPLAELIERVSAACYLETAKFRRGDYS